MRGKLFGVIGLGRFGFYVAKTLAQAGVEVIAVDNRQERVREIGDLVTQAYVVDALDEKALEESGIFNADCVVVSIGSNIEASILTVVMLRDRGVREIIAKAINPLHGKVLERLGVSRVVYPEMEMGIKLARSMLVSGLLEEFPFAEGYSIVELKVPQDFIDRSLKELDLRNRMGITILAIKREGKAIVNPKAQERLRSGDTILILGKEDSILKLGRAKI
jgi:trk system potassium uptake protein TrkA